MSEIWPADLPQRFSDEGFQYQLGSSIIRSEMDVGPAKSRRRTTAVVEPMSGSMKMTEEQVEILRDFFEVTVLQGSVEFDFPDPFGGTSDLLVRFVRPPILGYRTTIWWNVGLELEVLP